MKYRYLRARIEGGFWRSYQDLVRDEVLTYQWRALNDLIPGAPPSHSIENFKITAGMSRGSYEGMVFQDSDLAKWLEAAGHALADDNDTSGELRAWVEEAVELIARAQQDDGYLNTYFTIMEPERRWTNLREAHELYCAGHFIEAGVSVHRSTGNEKVLDVVRRLADHIDARFGRKEGKRRGYPGHEEIELALVKLYRATGEGRYLDLADYFVSERGATPSYFDQEMKSESFVSIFGIKSLEYCQAHTSVLEQRDAVGHAVRAMYLYAAMADLAFENGNEALGEACDRMWESTAQRQMYVTGGIGSSAYHESFTTDYDLPNDTAYAETCAAIGLFLFSHRMAVYRNRASYVDVMERTLYNGILSGIALDGHAYFYVNPLEVVPSVCDHNPAYHHVKYRRQPWYGCACCPPNIARLLASLGEYCYHMDSDTLYVDLFHTGKLACRLGSADLTVSQETDYPWEGSVRLTIGLAADSTFGLALRVPGWCRTPEVSVNGAPIAARELLRDGYLRISRSWHERDEVKLTLPMAVERVRSHPGVRSAFGRVAIARGPIVYCLEEEDNGKDLHEVTLSPGAALEASFRRELLGGVVAVRAHGNVASGGGSTALYARDGAKNEFRPKELLFVPYYAWANRTAGEMRVWITEGEARSS